MSDPAFQPHDHAHCTSDLLARAESLAATRGLRFTPIRRRVLEILAEAHRALGAYDVLERLAAEGHAHQPPVAYRALEFLEHQGFAHRIRRLNAYAACTHPGEDHSAAFLICRTCHTIAEAPAAPVAMALSHAAAPHGFAIEHTTIEATGLCPACQEAA
jgi:Fur family transcriptional regulator, zinc uptake regulator